MCKKYKKRATFILILCMCVLSFRPVEAASINSDNTFEIPKSNEIMPLYNNVISANSTMSINSNGKMTITYRYTGYSESTTKAVITTYIQKRVLGLFWTKVDIGETDNQWVDTIKNYKYNGSRTFQLSDSGTYRVCITYKIYGTGGSADTITSEIEDSY